MSDTAAPDTAATVRAVAAARAEGSLPAENDAATATGTQPLAVSYEKRGIVVTLDDQSFVPRQAVLSAAGDARLAEVANFLASYPGRSVLVETHTDSAGTAPDNLQLSQRRAEIVRAALLARGVSPSNLTARGYGETYPIASNASAPGRAKNRRIEIVLLPPGQTGPQYREMFEASAGDLLATEPGEGVGSEPGAESPFDLGDDTTN